MFARSRAAMRALRNRASGFATSAARQAEVQLTVDGRKVSIEAGSAVIQAVEKAGIQIPRYCYHEKLAVAGSCRMCLVEVERNPKLVASCSFPVANGMVVHTDSERISKSREYVTEMLLANHPLDCPVCDQGGECDLQDQSLRYGSDRGRFNEISGKRAVEDKDIGPLVKMTMTRCIQCTRCVRFANEVAGAPELGTTGRGNDLQIGTFLHRNFDTELSGNIIDLCPVGALTSRPYSFKARPWELKKTESVDVLDGLGSNIRVDSRGQAVLRVIPRRNDAVNDEWISDKTRFAVDGLNTQRLTVPLIKHEGQLKPASWEDALLYIQAKFEDLRPKGNEFKAIVGDLADVESMVALKDLTNRLGSDNLAHDFKAGDEPLAHGVDLRANYLFNSTISGIDEADAILLVGTNPRHEAAVLNARIRQRWLHSDLQLGLVGPEFNSTFDYEYLGNDVAALSKALNGKFGRTLAKAQRPMIIVGSNVVEHEDAAAIFRSVGEFANKNSNVVNDGWNGVNVLQRAASRAGAFDIGFAPSSPDAASTKPKIVYLLGADEISPSSLPQDAFVIYQGHHGDVGAPLADVVLPGAAYTEKNATFVNTEGRVQTTRAAVGPPGAAREDWHILKAISDVLGVNLPYDSEYEMRDRVAELAPNLVEYDIVTPSALGGLAVERLADVKGTASNHPLRPAVENFYFTNSISRSSPTMAKCIAAFPNGAR